MKLKKPKIWKKIIKRGQKQMLLNWQAPHTMYIHVSKREELELPFWMKVCLARIDIYVIFYYKGVDYKGFLKPNFGNFTLSIF